MNTTILDLRDKLKVQANTSLFWLYGAGFVSFGYYLAGQISLDSSPFSWITTVATLSIVWLLGVSLFILHRSLPLNLEQKLACFLGSLMGPLFLHLAWKFAPWHVLSIGNDGAHALDIAQRMQTGDTPYVLFSPLFLGRVSLPMALEGIFLEFFSLFQIPIYIFFVQVVTIYSFNLLLQVFLGFEFASLKRWKNSSLIFFLATISGFSPFLFMAASNVDMYQLSTWYTILFLFSAFSHRMMKDRWQNFAWGVVASVGLNIAPSTKFLSLAFIGFLFLKSSHKKYLVAGFMPVFLYNFGLWSFHRSEMMGREQELMQTLFWGPLHSLGWWPFLQAKWMSFYQNTCYGMGFNLIFSRNFATASQISYLSFWELPLFFIPLFVKHFRLPYLALMLLTLAQVFVSNTTDYRMVHMLFGSLLGALILAIAIMRFIKTKAKREIYLWSAAFLPQLLLLFQMTQIDYTKSIEVNGQLVRPWILWEPPSSPESYIWTVEAGHTGLILKQNPEEFSASIKYLPLEQQIEQIEYFLLKSHTVELRLFNYFAEELVQSYHQGDFSKHVQLDSMNKIKSKLWPWIEDEATQLRFSLK